MALLHKLTHRWRLESSLMETEDLIDGDSGLHFFVGIILEYFCVCISEYKQKQLSIDGMRFARYQSKMETLQTETETRTTADNPFVRHSLGVLKWFVSGAAGEGPWYEGPKSREANTPWGTMEQAKAELNAEQRAWVLVAARRALQAC